MVRVKKGLFGGFTTGGCAFPVDPRVIEEKDFGTCCICVDHSASSVFFLPLETPKSGTGWGCLMCGSPFNGAIIVLCACCIPRFAIGGPAMVQEFVWGQVGSYLRRPLKELANPLTREPIPFLPHKAGYHDQFIEGRVMGGQIGRSEAIFGLN